MSTPYSETHHTLKSTEKYANIFFSKLKGNALKIANELAEKNAESMVYILRHRQRLKGQNGGQYPRFDGKDPRRTPSNKPSNKSFDKWEAVKKKDGLYVIKNTAVSMAYRHKDGYFKPDTWQYSYAKALITGKSKYWGKNVKNSKLIGTSKSRLVRKGSLIFSKQLPDGLEPWLKLKRDSYEKNLKKRIR